MNLTAGKMTARAFMWSRVLGIPFWVMLNTLTLILYKELHISPFLATLLIALKPITALAATHWSAYFSNKNRYFVLSNILRFLPFIFLFLFPTAGFSIFAFVLYMTLSRGTMPVWMELFKAHLPEKAQPRLFAFGNTLEYLGTTLCPIAIGVLLDYNPGSWKLIFPLTAALGLLSTFFLLRLPDVSQEPQKKALILPWKNSFQLIKKRPDFRAYLFGFMLGGAGLMILQPVLPIFFVDELQLSYTEMMIAIAVCKGVGFAIASPFWVNLFRKLTIHSFGVYIALLAACFPLLLFGAKASIWLLYLAYLAYGYMQSGSELSWHLSAAAFSKQEKSLSFSETNLLAVGVRGCLIPFLGYCIFSYCNSLTVMVAGSLFCLGGAWLLHRFNLHQSVVEKPGLPSNS